MDASAIVNEKIIKLLEAGVVPWRKPWTPAGLPRNLVSKKPYRGVNAFLLSASKYISPFWLTIRQADELGGHLHKGEESTIVIYWKVDDVRQRSEDSEVEEPEVRPRRRFLLRFYRVFNLEQCELPPTVTDKLPRSNRTGTIQSKRSSRLLPACLIRRRLSARAYKHFTRRSLIA